MTYEIHYATDEHAKQWKKLPVVYRYRDVRNFIRRLQIQYGAFLRYRVITKDCEPMT